MRYSDRCFLFAEKKVEGYLGEEIDEEIKKITPCSKSVLSLEEQQNIFGGFKRTALKLHLQGIHRDFSKIEYQGVIRTISSVTYHRNSTVVIVE